jgi:hypothetical protein
MPIQRINHKLNSYKQRIIGEPEEISTIASIIFRCNKYEAQINQSSEATRGVGQMNILNIRNKSMLIVQLKEKSKFKEVCSNFTDLNEAYFFYEGNKKLMKENLLEEGDHFIFYYSKLLGGSGKPPESDEEYEEEDMYDDESESSEEENFEEYDYDEFVFTCRANDQLKFEWWWNVEYEFLMQLILEEIKDNIGIEISERWIELEYILLVEQEGDKRDYVLRLNPFYDDNKFGKPTEMKI